MSDYFTSIGATVEVALGGELTDGETELDLLTYAEILGVEGLPAVGAEYENTQIKTIKLGVIETEPTFLNPGGGDITYRVREGDAGQAALEAGTTGANKGQRHTVRVTYASGAKRYWVGKFYSNPEDPSDGSSVVAGTTNMILDRIPLKVAAP